MNRQNIPFFLLNISNQLRTQNYDDEILYYQMIFFDDLNNNNEEEDFINQSFVESHDEYFKDRKLSVEELNKLDALLRRVKRLSEFEKNQDCCICFDKIEDKKNFLKLYCNHFYHEECIREWFKEKLKKNQEFTCPCCIKPQK